MLHCDVVAQWLTRMLPIKLSYEQFEICSAVLWRYCVGTKVLFTFSVRWYKTLNELFGQSSRCVKPLLICC